MSKEQLKGTGWVVPKTSRYVYVLGTIGGQFYRKSTGQEPTKAYLAWIKKPGNAQKKLEEIIGLKVKEEGRISLEKYGLAYLQTPSRKRGEQQRKNRLGIFHKWIIPSFKNYALEDIAINDIEAWQVYLLKHVSSSRAKQCENVLNDILHRAVGERKIMFNPIAHIDRIKAESTRRDAYTNAEMVAMLTESTGMLKAFLFVAFTTGIRTGEILGLRREDIDFDAGIITVRRSMSRQLKASKLELARLKSVGVDIHFLGSDDQKSSGAIIAEEVGETKNHDYIANMPRVTVEVLKSYLHHVGGQWIFANRANRPYTESKKLLGQFKPLLERLGIEFKDLYATRHTFSSILEENGVDNDYTRERMGHSEDSKVLETNYQVREKQGRDWSREIEAVNNIFTKMLSENVR